MHGTIIRAVGMARGNNLSAEIFWIVVAGKMLDKMRIILNYLFALQKTEQVGPWLQ